MKASKIIGQLLESKTKQINDWMMDRYNNLIPCVYSSVDLRDAGYKIAPVDTNIFPAGFNNLSENGQVNAIKEMKDYLSLYFPEARNIVLIPENHTRNKFYLANVQMLVNILTKAGYQVRVKLVGCDEEQKAEISLAAPGLKAEVAINKQGKIIFENEQPADLILLNTDLTSGVPLLLQDISLPIIPSIELGWYSRTKSNHFKQYNQIVEEFGREFSIDPFLISTTFFSCGQVNFKEKNAIECVALNVEKAIYHIQKQYNEHGIKDQPYVYIKADRGTYGMGIMTASSGEEIYQLNKQLRNQMNKIKEGNINSEVIIQEGVRTINKVENANAEPLAYLVGGNVVDLFFRYNNNKDNAGNLNSQGALITSNFNSPLQKPYELIARLAALAAALEIN